MTAIFLVVVLGLLAAFIVAVTGMQVSSHQLDVLGARAYQAARAGIEWAAYQTLDPNNTQNVGTCGPPVNMPSCPASPTHLVAPAGFPQFTVSVTCTSTPTTEGNQEIRVFRVTAVACNQPAGGSCLGVTPATGYVEREVTATLSKCRDSTASPPRCSCG